MLQVHYLQDMLCQLITFRLVTSVTNDKQSQVFASQIAVKHGDIDLRSLNRHEDNKWNIRVVLFNRNE